MTVLRSREVKSDPITENKPDVKTLENRDASIESITPSSTRDMPSEFVSDSHTPPTVPEVSDKDGSRPVTGRRRSLRLAMKSCNDDAKVSQLVSSSERKSDGTIDEDLKLGGTERKGCDMIVSEGEDGESLKRKGCDMIVSEGEDGESLKKRWSKRKLFDEFESFFGAGEGSKLRSGKKVASYLGAKRNCIEKVKVLENDKKGYDIGNVGGSSVQGVNQAEITKTVSDLIASLKMKVDVGPADVGNRQSVVTVSLSDKGKGKGKLVGTASLSDKGMGRLSWEEKGKNKLLERANRWHRKRQERLNREANENLVVEPQVQGAAQVLEDNVGADANRARDRFRAQARRSASKFAFFSTTEEEEKNETEQREMENDVEDWPGPFSTAIKIIRDREKNMNLQQKGFPLDKEIPQVTWVPKLDKNHKRSNSSVPLLQELCLKALANNADAITSLDCVPDVLRHRLSHLLCDRRKMNSHFLELLARESPTEIRIRDCSWLDDKDFKKIFKEADIANLGVLQLDNCGRCMQDEILYTTLARSPNCLRLLTTLSLKGACQLSDIGLSSLLSSAPALRSLNLSQCSLLTSAGISNIADSLGSVLRELYLDDCESIDPILMLPALSKLEYLEVLSLAGLHSVCDDFICQLIALRGNKLKELVLADCMYLTNSSLKVISESCTGIYALDLTNLSKLTDSALGYLANGCHFIRSLKLRRNIFSDEAIAAYLEASGGSLEELSLNNVTKVAHNTAISLSKCSKNLQNLDLSWCRNLSDEAVGLIVDSCPSLKILKLFGCTQITDVFLDGHSNEQVQVVGLQMTPILEHIKVPELIGPLRYSSAPSF